MENQQVFDVPARLNNQNSLTDEQTIALARPATGETTVFDTVGAQTIDIRSIPVRGTVFQKSGDDLVLELPDQSRIVFTDFFAAAESAPKILEGFGWQLDGQQLQEALEEEGDAAFSLAEGEPRATADGIALITGFTTDIAELDTVSVSRIQISAAQETATNPLEQPEAQVFVQVEEEEIDEKTDVPDEENAAPVAEDVAATTPEGESLIVATEASDGDGDALTYTVDTSGTLGMVTNNGDGRFTYDPDGRFESLAVGETATDTFTYTVSDGNGGTDTATVTVTIEGENDAPIAKGVATTASENESLIIAADASDVDGDGLTYEIDATGMLGMVTNNGDGTFTYDPNGRFESLAVGETAEDTFTYTVSDGNGGANMATVTVTVEGENDAPVAEDVVATASEDDSLAIAADASDVDGDGLTYATDTSGTLGTVTNNGDGTFLYDPDDWFESLSAGETAVDTFTYTVSDGNGGTDTATVTVTVEGKNDAPEAGNDQLGGEGIESPDFPVNTETEGGQYYPQITTLVGGGFVITWHSNDGDDDDGYGIKARIYDADGEPTGAEFLVNTETEGSQSSPQITALDGGGFVITWHGNDGQDKRGYGIKARIYDADGKAVGAEFLVNTETNGNQYDPHVTALAGGGFIVTWRSADGEDNDGYGIKAQIFDADGKTVDAEFLVNTETEGGQYYPHVTTLASGGFVIAWQSSGSQDGDRYGIKAQIYGADGKPAGGEFLVNTETKSSQVNPDIAALANGGFVITWHSSDGQDDTSDTGIKAQIFDAGGDAVGEEFLVNTQTQGSQLFPHITTLAGGGFVISWSSAGGEDDDGRDIRAQIYDAGGKPVGEEILINAETNDDQRFPSIAALPDGGFVVAWQSEDGVEDDDRSGIKARMFDAEGNPRTYFDAATDEDTVLRIAEDGLLENDTDADDGDMPRISSVSETSALGAALTLADTDDDGAYEIYYDSAASATLQALTEGEAITDTFTYTVTDEDGETDTATVEVTVEGVNDIPVAEDDLLGGYGLAATDEDTVLRIASDGLLENDTDADNGDMLTITSVSETSALGADLTLADTDGDGAYEIYYDPSKSATLQALAEGETKEDTFTYTVTDGYGGTDTATVTVTVSGNSIDPVAADDDLDADGSLALGEFLVNSSTSGNQYYSSVTTLSNGGFVVAWHSRNGDEDTSNNGSVRAQVYDELGNPVGEEIFLSTNTYAINTLPNVAGLDDGGFVVTWSSMDRNSGGISAQIFDASGDLVTDVFQVNSEEGGLQYQPKVLALDDGFVVTWAGDHEIWARLFDAGGNPLADEFLVNFGNTDGDQLSPQIAALAEDGFVISWTDEGAYDGVQAKTFDENGAAVGDQISVGEGWTSCTNGGITALEGGGFVATWHGSRSGSVGHGGRWGEDDTSYDQGIYARIYDEEGNARDIVAVNQNAAGNQFYPITTALADGGFVVVWYSTSDSEDNSGYSVKGRIFEADGTGGEEFLVNTETFGNQSFPSVSARADGGFVVVWQSSEGTEDQDGSSIKALVFDADGNPMSFADTTVESVLTIHMSDLLANDSDPYSGTPVISGVDETSAKGATIAVNGDGTISYDASASSELQSLSYGEHATDTFTYTLANDDGGSSTATVTVTVQKSTSSPEISLSSDQISYADTADDDTFSPVGISYSIFDLEGDFVSYTITPDSLAAGVDAPGAFTYDGTSSTGVITFVPDDNAIEGYTFDQTFTYTLAMTDSTGSISTETLTVSIQAADTAFGLVETTGTYGSDYLIEPSEGFAFEIDGAVAGTWTSAEIGLLAVDLDGSGAIEDGSELISHSFGGGDFSSGLEALASYDSNGDGLISVEDENFAEISLWVDADSDGITDLGELLGLLDHGIAEIDLSSALAADETVDGIQAASHATAVTEDDGAVAFLEIDFNNTIVVGPAEVLAADAADAVNEINALALAG